MSAYLYDKALTEELRKITGDSRISIVAPENSISFLAQINKDKVDFPAIVLSRGPITLTETPNQVVAFKGQTVRINEDNTATKIKLLPMRMEWQLDVYAVDRYSCDEIIREVIFYLYTHPRLSVQVPYGADIPQNFDVFINPEITDNSDLIEFADKGTLFRETIVLYTENAHLFSTGRIYLTKSRIDIDIDK